MNYNKTKIVNSEGTNISIQDNNIECVTEYIYLELVGRGRKQPAAVLKGAEGEIVAGIKEKLKRWNDFVETLFIDNRSKLPLKADDAEEIGPEITSY
ncbi:hypothetical protein HUJ04_000483 [Dendroctonus ponderosae]|nr:hypothetical protein HUJ04_000483 [Dendroctonus ponderosae]